MKDLSKLRVAIVHDWLVGGGAELVVLELHKMFPDAPIYTSYCTKEWRQKLDDKVVTGYLQHWPFSSLRKFLPLLRFWWFERLNLSSYDLVISSSGNGEAKSVKVPTGTLHICYCHSPTHFYWRHYETYQKQPGFGGPLAKLGLKLLVGSLRKRDKKAAQLPDYFIANSAHIQSDIKKYYGRDSVVIHPPIDVGRFAIKANVKRQGFITVGRQVPYKKIDLIVEACSRLNLLLTVIGNGPEHRKLVRLAGPSVDFITNASDEDVAIGFQGAEAFILAAFEDFGITQVEAMAAGTPVIAYRAGGALDYVQPGKTGLFFDHQTAASLEQVLKNFKPNAFDAQGIQKFAKQFDANHFRQAIQKFIEEKIS